MSFADAIRNRYKMIPGWFVDAMKQKWDEQKIVDEINSQLSAEPLDNSSDWNVSAEEIADFYRELFLMQEKR